MTVYSRVDGGTVREVLEDIIGEAFNSKNDYAKDGIVTRVAVCTVQGAGRKIREKLKEMGLTRQVKNGEAMYAGLDHVVRVRYTENGAVRITDTNGTGKPIALDWTSPASIAWKEAHEASQKAHAATKAATRETMRSTGRKYWNASKSALSKSPSRETHSSMSVSSEAHRETAAKLYDVAEKHNQLADMTPVGRLHAKAYKENRGAAKRHDHAADVHEKEHGKSGRVKSYGRGEDKVVKKTNSMTHEVMRVKTMSDKALETRIGKITSKDKMTKFAGALKSAGKDKLAKMARKAAMSLSDKPQVTHEEFQALYNSQGGSAQLSYEAEIKNPLLSDADKRKDEGQAGSLNSINAEVRKTKAHGFFTPNSDKTVLQR